MAQPRLVWNTGHVDLGQVRRTTKQELSTIEKISIVSIAVSLASLAWNMYTYSSRKKC